jgi:hypothetical protein
MPQEQEAQKRVQVIQLTYAHRKDCKKHRHNSIAGDHRVVGFKERNGRSTQCPINVAFAMLRPKKDCLFSTEPYPAPVKHHRIGNILDMHLRRSANDLVY